MEQFFGILLLLLPCVCACTVICWYGWYRLSRLFDIDIDIETLELIEYE